MDLFLGCTLFVHDFVDFDGLGTLVHGSTSRRYYNTRYYNYVYPGWQVFKSFFMSDKSSETLTAKFIEELTKVRKERGISHEKLAEKTGLSRSTISFTESGRTMPTVLTCVRIAKALGIRIGDLFNKFDK